MYSLLLDPQTMKNEGLKPQKYMGEITPKDEGNVGCHGTHSANNSPSHSLGGGLHI